MDLEKRHCCCCILLPDGVLLLGLYGVCVHTGLLIVQCIYGRPLTPLADEQVGLVDEMVLHPTLIALHIIGIVVNALLGEIRSFVLSTVKSRLNEWPPSAPFHSLN